MSQSLEALLASGLCVFMAFMTVVWLRRGGIVASFSPDWVYRALEVRDTAEPARVEPRRPTPLEPPTPNPGLPLSEQVPAEVLYIPLPGRKRKAKNKRKIKNDEWPWPEE